GGTLWLDQGGDNSGYYTNASAGMLVFNSGTHIARDGVRFAGEGQYAVSGSAALLAAGIVTAGATNSAGSFSLTAGTIGGGNFVAQGSFNWTGGYISGLFTVAPGAVLNASGGGDYKWLSDSAVLENLGTVNWQGGASFRGWTQNGPATMNIRSNAVLNLSAEGTVFSRHYGWQPFYVSVSPGGQIHKTSGGENQFYSIYFDLAGELRMDTGVLVMSTPVTLEDGARLAGAGTARQTGDQINLNGQVTLDGARFEQTAGNFAMASGGGTVQTANAGIFDWSAGWLIGVLNLASNSTMTLSGTDYKWFADSAELRNYGSITWSSGSLRGYTYGGLATVHNYPSGRFVIGGQVAFSRHYGWQPAYFINDGTLVAGTPGGLVTGDWQFTQRPSGIFELPLSGPAAASDFGHWATSQGAALDGTLRVLLANNFAPAPGQLFTFLDGSSHSGVFAGAQLPTLPGGLIMAVDDYGSSVSLRIDQAGPCAALPSGPIAWYPADGSPLDVIGLRQAAPANPGAYTSGKVGRAFRFNGANDQVELGTWFNLQQFSISMWVRPGPGENTYADIMDNNHTGFRSWVVQYANADDGTHVTFGWGLAGVGYIPFNLTKGVWQHLALTLDSNYVATVYLDGVPAGTVTGSGPVVYDGSQSLRLGNWGQGGRFFNGSIDDVVIFDHAISSNDIAAITAASLAGFCRTNNNCVPPPSGLIGWWPGDKDGSDLAGTNSGRLINTAGIAPAVVGNGFSFDGSTALVDLGNNASLQVSGGDFTAAAWVEFNALGSSDQSIMDKMAACGAGNCDGWRLFKQADGRFWFCLGGGSGNNGCAAGSPNTLQSATMPVARTWYHVAAVKSAARFSLYVNGVLEQNKPLPSFADTHSTDLLLGANGSQSAYLNGLVDEAMLFNRALSSNEISSLFAAGTAGACKLNGSAPCVPLPSGAVAWWPGDNSGMDLVGTNYFAFYNGVSFSNGLVGNAFSFSGNHDQAFSTSPSLTNLANTFTMEFWAWPGASRASTPENNSGIEGTSAQRYAIYPEHGGSGGVLAGAGVVSVFEHASNYLPSLLVYDAPILGWTHIAVVYQSRTPQLYVNGALVRTGLASQRGLVFPSKNLGDASNYGPYAGLLDEVAIFNRALTPAEIAAIYEAGSSGFCSTNYNVPTLPDLAVSGIFTPADATVVQTAVLTFTMTNQGGSAAFGPWVNQFLLASSPAGSGAQVIGSATFNGEIVAGGSL
ncbi:MAG: LamG domain-containing protein, partial [Verrucomicrobia bacterium]|nr:LamG domain-containing protein [Verrucomicrobiota bacterium]